MIKKKQTVPSVDSTVIIKTIDSSKSTPLWLKRTLQIEVNACYVDMLLWQMSRFRKCINRNCEKALTQLLINRAAANYHRKVKT